MVIDRIFDNLIENPIFFDVDNLIDTQFKEEEESTTSWRL
jgi:hypothetical protein